MDFPELYSGKRAVHWKQLDTAVQRSACLLYTSEVYCKSFLITQEEKQALSLVEDFYAGVLKEIGEALKAEDQNLWFWQQYYKKIRREYQKLLSVQHKEAPGKAQKLAQILAAQMCIRYTHETEWTQNRPSAEQCKLQFPVRRG